MTLFLADAALHESQVWFEPEELRNLAINNIMCRSFIITFCLHSILSGSMASSVFARLFFTDCIYK